MVARRDSFDSTLSLIRDGQDLLSVLSGLQPSLSGDRRELNPRKPVPQTGAITILPRPPYEAPAITTPRIDHSYSSQSGGILPTVSAKGGALLVRLAGLEPAVFWSQTRRITIFLQPDILSLFSCCVGSGRFELPTSCSLSEPHTSCVRSDMKLEKPPG